MRSVLLRSVIIAAGLLTSRSSASAIDIAPASAWGAEPATAPAVPQTTITHITLHHQGEDWLPGKDVPTYLRKLQHWSPARLPRTSTKARRRCAPARTSIATWRTAGSGAPSAPGSTASRCPHCPSDQAATG